MEIVLDGYDRGNRARLGEVGGINIAEAEMADQTLLAQTSEYFEAFGKRFAVWDFPKANTQVNQVKVLQAQRFEILLDGGTQIGSGSLSRTIGTHDRADLRGNDEIRWVRVESLANQGIGTDGTVAALVEGGGVDVVNTKFDGAPQDSTTNFGIARRATHAIGGQAHGTETHPVDG
jgi:hypothetical protein